MKILFAPSESKSNFTDSKKMEISFCKELYTKREEAIRIYDNFNKITENIKEFGKDRTSIFERESCKAIQRYTGVSFEYLDYSNLDNDSQNYIEENLILFSNLFGPILAKDRIPNYTFKQGAKIDNFKIEKFYKDNFSECLDKFLGNEEVLDLRAKFYEKQYKPKYATTIKFLKNGKVVSHWAKAYRGIVAKESAKNKIKTIDELLKLDFENMNLKDINESKTSKELIFEILL